MAQESCRWNVQVPALLDRQLEDFVKKKAFASKSEFIRTAVRDRIKKELEEVERDNEGSN